jgi:hypothetical protein
MSETTRFDVAVAVNHLLGALSCDSLSTSTTISATAAPSDL